MSREYILVPLLLPQLQLHHFKLQYPSSSLRVTCEYQCLHSQAALQIIAVLARGHQTIMQLKSLLSLEKTCESQVERSLYMLG